MEPKIQLKFIYFKAFFLNETLIKKENCEYKEKVTFKI